MDSLYSINDSSFQTLFELSPSIIAVIDIEKFTFKKINKAFVEILGYNKENLINKPINEVNLIADISTMDNLAGYIKNRKSVRNFELIINTRNDTIHCKLHGDVLDKNTNKEYIIIMCNLTTQKNIENELKNAEFKVMAILDTLPIQAWIKNTDSVYIDVNKEYLRTWSKSLDQILGFTDRDIFPHELAEQYIEKDKFVMASGKRTHFEEIIDNENGTLIYETYKTPIRNANGEICGTFGISQNITNKKRIAAELVKAKELVEAHSEAKSMFLANMSHEIRTHLNGLMGFLHLLDNTQLTKQQSEFVKNIKVSSKLLKIVTDDILDVSKIQIKGIKLENIPFDLCKTIEDAIIPFTANLYNKKIDINLFIHPDVPQYVSGDPIKLRQAISNIFNNAIKFTEKGCIFVEAALDNVNEQKYEISFKIKDTGIGIPQNSIGDLFTPFKRAENTIHNKLEGTGLGLYISNSIINEMNGTIRVKSKVGIGSTFTFTVWLEKLKTMPQYSEPDYSMLKNKKVLIVGNNAITNNIVKSYLNEKGVISVENRNVTDAIFNVMNYPENNYDALIISHDPTDIKSYEITSAVQTIDSTKHTPLFLIFPRKIIDNLPLSKQNDNIEIIYKPFRKEDLYNSLMKVFDSVKFDDENTLQNTPINQKPSEPSIENKIKLLLVENDQLALNDLISNLSNEHYHYDVAIDGQEAVIAFANSNYDIILMNCKMSIMDVYETTRQIRQIESNVKHTPIIGICPHDQCDKNKCFEAGIDEIIRKSLDFDSLKEILKKYITISLLYSSNTRNKNYMESIFDDLDFCPERKQKVMIVDDTPMNLELLKIALASEYDTTVITNGSEALDIAAETPPDIILLDIAMPGMNGYEVLSKLRENEKTKDIPVVFLTAMQDAESEEYGLKLGAIDFIKKPFSIPIVKTKLKNHLDLKKYKDCLKENSFIDPLTKMPNRRRFNEALSKEMKKMKRSGSCLSLLMIDIDNFKLYNDTYGHLEGDECLARVARELKITLKRPSDLVARWGGEEFTCLLPETDKKGAIKVAEKLRKAVKSLEIAHKTSEVADVVTISVGAVTLYPGDKNSKDTFLKQADDALYRAKAMGKDCIYL